MDSDFVYSSDSYLQKRGSMRRGFGGNYRRASDSFTASGTKQLLPLSTGLSMKNLNICQKSSSFCQRNAAEKQTTDPNVVCKSSSGERAPPRPGSFRLNDSLREKTLLIYKDTDSGTRGQSRPLLRQGCGDSSQAEGSDSRGVCDGRGLLCSTGNRNSLTLVAEDETVSLSVTECIRNFERIDACRRRCSVGESRPKPVSKTRVAELRESILRRSSENLSDVGATAGDPSHLTGRPVSAVLDRSSGCCPQESKQPGNGDGDEQFCIGAVTVSHIKPIPPRPLSSLLRQPVSAIPENSVSGTPQNPANSRHSDGGAILQNLFGANSRNRSCTSPARHSVGAILQHSADAIPEQRPAHAIPPPVLRRSSAIDRADTFFPMGQTSEGSEDVKVNGNSVRRQSLDQFHSLKRFVSFGDKTFCSSRNTKDTVDKSDTATGSLVKTDSSDSGIDTKTDSYASRSSAEVVDSFPNLRESVSPGCSSAGTNSQDVSSDDGFTAKQLCRPLELETDELSQLSTEELLSASLAARVVGRLESGEDELRWALLPSSAYKTSLSYVADVINGVKLPESWARMPDGQNVEESCADEMSLDELKLKLLGSVEHKLEIVKQNKDRIETEISKQRNLESQICELAKCRMEKRQFDKFHLYLDELDKVLHLILMLSSRLANVENALVRLQRNDDKVELKKSIAKRDSLMEKLSDAKLLKDGIDRRSQAIDSFLRESLSESEYKSYCHLVANVTRLHCLKQWTDDRIGLYEKQLKLLVADHLSCGSSEC